MRRTRGASTDLLAAGMAGPALALCAGLALPATATATTDAPPTHGATDAEAETPVSTALSNTTAPIDLRLSFRLEDESPRRPRLRIPRARTAGEAFRAELRDEALRFRDSGRWALVAPALEDDPIVREARSKAAERALGDAVEAGLEALLLGRDHPTNRKSTPLFSQSLRIDSTPSWRVVRRTARGAMSVDVPLTTSSLRLHCWRAVGGEKGIDRVAGTLALDPWDEAARVALSVDF